MKHQLSAHFQTMTVVIGSPDLYNAIRAAMILRGTGLQAWCKANGQNRQTIDRALKGERNSRRCRAIRDQLIAEFLSGEAAA